MGLNSWSLSGKVSQRVPELLETKKFVVVLGSRAKVWIQSVQIEWIGLPAGIQNDHVNQWVNQSINLLSKASCAPEPMTTTNFWSRNPNHHKLLKHELLETKKFVVVLGSRANVWIQSIQFESIGWAGIQNDYVNPWVSQSINLT